VILENNPDEMAYVLEIYLMITRRNNGAAIGNSEALPAYAGKVQETISILESRAAFSRQVFISN
jgi:hypothetical protein